MRLAIGLGVACVTLGLIACTSTSTSNSSAPSPSSLTVPPEAGSAVDAAAQDAASHLGVSRDQLQVAQVQAQEWPDASLGCPQPGQLYSQIVTPGYVVLIVSGSHQLEYHTDARNRVALCRET